MRLTKMIQDLAMRPAVVFLFSCGVLIAACGARAETCVDTAQNNPAFSSTYVAGEAPCKPKPKAAAVPVKPSEQRAARENARPAPVVIGDGKPHVVPTEHGTLIKSGDTTVCISGSVSVDLSAGNGLRGGPGRPAPAPGCY